MPRYIDADDLENITVVTYEGRLKRIDAPTADVEEVKHGEWVEKEHWVPLAWDCSPLDYENYNEKTHSEKRTYWHCSECDFEKSRNVKPSAAYCESCGAKMDGKGVIINETMQ